MLRLTDRVFCCKCWNATLPTEVARHAHAVVVAEICGTKKWPERSAIHWHGIICSVTATSVTVLSHRSSATAVTSTRGNIDPVKAFDQNSVIESMLGILGRVAQTRLTSEKRAHLISRADRCMHQLRCDCPRLHLHAPHFRSRASREEVQQVPWIVDSGTYTCVDPPTLNLKHQGVHVFWLKGKAAASSGQLWEHQLLDLSDGLRAQYPGICGVALATSGPCGIKHAANNERLPIVVYAVVTPAPGPTARVPWRHSFVQLVFLCIASCARSNQVADSRPRSGSAGGGPVPLEGARVSKPSMPAVLDPAGGCRRPRQSAEDARSARQCPNPAALRV